MARAVWTVCVVRVIHHTMDISQSRCLISLYKKIICLWDPKDVNDTNKDVRDVRFVAKCHTSSA